MIFHIYPNMNLTYGYGSLLKIVKITSLRVLPEFTMLQICVMISTLLLYDGMWVDL